jgi:hypothetical protein
LDAVVWSTPELMWLLVINQFLFFILWVFSVFPELMAVIVAFVTALLK